MQVELVAPDAASWHDVLREAEHDFYHLPAYVELCAATEGGAPRALHVCDGARRLLIPMVVRPLADDLRDASSPYGYPGPLVTGPHDQLFLLDALEAARAALAAQRVVTLFVRGHPFLGPRLEARTATVVHHGCTVSIDLTLPEPELWQHTMSGHRQEIRKAIRAGHRVFMDEEHARFDAFVRIYRLTMERLEASSEYLFSDAYFAALRDALGNRLHLCVVEIGGETAGGGLFVETAGVLQYHLSGTDPRFTHERPTKLMLHHVRAWAKQRGLRRMHLGGGVGGREDSLFRFKAGFATDRHVFQTLRVVCDDRAYATLVRAKHPDADPHDLTGFFPLYRKPAR